jgi:hypothetical protein
MTFTEEIMAAEARIRPRLPLNDNTRQQSIEELVPLLGDYAWSFVAMLEGAEYRDTLDSLLSN